MSVVYGNAVGGIVGYGKTFVLTDENGNELTGVVTGEEVIFTADPVVDIREGKVAATDAGIVTGSKQIPSYNTNEGRRIITHGSEFAIPSSDYDYTNLQAIICSFNTNIDNSVSAEKVVINDNVYDVQSTESISSIQKDSTTTSIKFGIVNTSGKPCLIRYFMYKEIY